MGEIHINASIQASDIIFCDNELATLKIEIFSINKLSFSQDVFPGQFYSPYSLFEYALFQTADKPRFNITGTFCFAHILVSCGFQDESCRKQKNELVNAIHHARNATLKIQNNLLHSLILDNQECIQLLHALNIDTHIVEIAFGVNSNIVKPFNKHINSPMNEGISGMHLGIGNGKGTYHLDFISPHICFDHFKKSGK